MNPSARLLVMFGGFLLLGLAAEFVGRRTPLPRVTILLLVGIAFGRSGFDILGPDVEVFFRVVGDIALGIVGFVIGGEMKLTALRSQQGVTMIRITVLQAAATASTVVIGLWLCGADVALALLLGGIATATAPAATIAVTQELKSKGPLTRTLHGVVALDDVCALLIFSLLMALAAALGGKGGVWISLGTGLWEVLGGVALGGLAGVPMAYLTGRLRPGDPTLLEVLGTVLLVVGLASALGVSYLLAAVTMGAVVVNLAKHHRRPFHAIEGAQTPFLVIFFLLAGATFELDSLRPAGWVGVGYILLRATGKLAGAWGGARLTNADPVVEKWLGATLLPQAGVAIGMALFAQRHFPEIAATLMSVVLAATVCFELVGPVLTRFALKQAGEARS